MEIKIKKSMLCLLALMTMGLVTTTNADISKKDKNADLDIIEKAFNKEKAKAEKAYNDLLKIRFTTNKKNRLKDLEQLGALLLIDALNEIKYVKGKPVEEKVNGLIKGLQNMYNTDQITKDKDVDLAHQWIIGKIGTVIFDYNKFAYQTKQPGETGQKKLDSELNLLNKDFKKIIKAIEKDLKKETSLFSMDAIKQFYGPLDDCPVCLETAPLIQFADSTEKGKFCEKPHICFSCKQKMIKAGKLACPVCGKELER